MIILLITGIVVPHNGNNIQVFYSIKWGPARGGPRVACLKYFKMLGVAVSSAILGISVTCQNLARKEIVCRNFISVVMCCHYFVGHVACQNLPWKGLLSQIAQVAPVLWGPNRRRNFCRAVRFYTLHDS